MQEPTQWLAGFHTTQTRHLLDEQCLAATPNATWHEPREELQQAHPGIYGLEIFFGAQFGEEPFDNVIIDCQGLHARRQLEERLALGCRATTVQQRRLGVVGNERERVRSIRASVASRFRAQHQLTTGVRREVDLGFLKGGLVSGVLRCECPKKLRGEGGVEARDRR